MQEIMTDALQGLTGLELAAVADTVADALAAFESHRPEVIILDLGLRTGSGMDVLLEVKRRAPACQVLVFTGCDAEKFRTHCLAAGADYFFSKHRQHDELIAQLRQLGGETSPVAPPPAAPFPSRNTATT